MAESTPTLSAGRHPPSILLFVLIVVAIVGADLWFKAWSFSHVAGEPLVLDRDPEDGTTLVQTRGKDGRLIIQQRARDSEPASAIPFHEGMTVIPKILDLRLTINTGAVFGLGKGKQWMFVIVSIVAVIVISYIFLRSASRAKWFHITLAMILGGALGNMYDRTMFNGVRDMCLLLPGMKLPFGLSWPQFLGGSSEVYPWIFNIADAALVIGVISLIIFTWRVDATRTATTAGTPRPDGPAKSG